MHIQLSGVAIELKKKTGDHPELWQSPGGAQLHPPILDDLPNFSEMGEKDAKIAHLKNIKDLMLVYFDRRPDLITRE